MRIYISGGCKNGKSSWAEELACAQRAPGVPLCYLATMRPADAEDEARVRRHRAGRAGKGFATIECLSAGAFAALQPPGVFLLDSVTALLSNEMFAPGAAAPDAGAGERILGELGAFLDRCPSAVLVSDAIFSDAQLYDGWTQAYRRALARLDRALAARCDAVLEVTDGLPLIHRGAARLAADLPAFAAKCAVCGPADGREEGRP